MRRPLPLATMDHAVEAPSVRELGLTVPTVEEIDPISVRDSRNRWALAVADLAALVITYVLMRYAIAPGDTPPVGTALLVAPPLWLVVNKLLRLYDRSLSLVHKSTLNEFPTIVQAALLSTAVLFILVPSIAAAAVERGWLIGFWTLVCALTAAFRATARTLAVSLTKRERVLVVGSGVVASLVADRLDAHPEYGTTVAGYVDTEDVPGTTRVAGTDRLGGVRDFEAICHKQNIERVVIAFSSLPHESLLDMVRLSKRLNLKVSIVPRLFEVVGHSVEFDQIEGLTLLTLRRHRRTRGTLALKRLTDIAGAAFLLLILSPLMFITALVVRFTSPGPVLFVQERTGKGNRGFRMYKFRTMVEGAEAMKAQMSHLNELADGRMFKITEDPRFTPPGRFLRRMSIDELPQLFNVLRGEMSLVGPRPLVPEETDQILGWHRSRLDLTPGLTGPWQVMGRNAIPFDEMVKIDYLYVTDWSLWNDFKLMLRTLPVVVSRRGK